MTLTKQEHGAAELLHSVYGDELPTVEQVDHLIVELYAHDQAGDTLKDIIDQQLEFRALLSQVVG